MINECSSREADTFPHWSRVISMFLEATRKRFQLPLSRPSGLLSQDLNPERIIERAMAQFSELIEKLGRQGLLHDPLVFLEWNPGKTHRDVAIERGPRITDDDLVDLIARTAWLLRIAPSLRERFDPDDQVQRALDTIHHEVLRKGRNVRIPLDADAWLERFTKLEQTHDVIDPGSDLEADDVREAVNLFEQLDTAELVHAALRRMNRATESEAHQIARCLRQLRDDPVTLAPASERVQEYGMILPLEVEEIDPILASTARKIPALLDAFAEVEAMARGPVQSPWGAHPLEMIPLGDDLEDGEDLVDPSLVKGEHVPGKPAEVISIPRSSTSYLLGAAAAIVGARTEFFWRDPSGRFEACLELPANIAGPQAEIEAELSFYDLEDHDPIPKLVGTPVILNGIQPGSIDREGILNVRGIAREIRPESGSMTLQVGMERVLWNLIDDRS